MSMDFFDFQNKKRLQAGETKKKIKTKNNTSLWGNRTLVINIAH